MTWQEEFEEKSKDWCVAFVPDGSGDEYNAYSDDAVDYDEIKAWFLSKLTQLADEMEDAWNELEGFAEHSIDCILSQWSAGRPTDDGGYEGKFGGVWYQQRPIDKTPKCTCGLSEVREAMGKVRKGWGV